MELRPENVWGELEALPSAAIFDYGRDSVPVARMSGHVHRLLGEWIDPAVVHACRDAMDRPHIV